MASLRTGLDGLRAVTRTGAIEAMAIAQHERGEIVALRRRDVYVDMEQYITSSLETMVTPIFDFAKGKKDINLDGVEAIKLAEAVTLGSATLLVNSTTGETMGYVRLKPRLDAPTKTKLNLNRNYEIREMGTLIVDDIYTENGFSTKLIQSLIGANQQRIQEQQLLVIATMKTPVTMLAFKSAFGAYNPALYNHLEFDMIAPLTCRCTMPLGTGFQVAGNADGYCSSRIPAGETYLLNPINNAKKGTRISKPALRILDDREHCVFFVSDAELAGRINEDLRLFYSEKAAQIKGRSVLPKEVRVFTESLREIGYYE